MTRRAVPDPKTYAALTRDALAADRRAALAAVDARYTQGGISYSTWVRLRGECERRIAEEEKKSLADQDAKNVV